MLLNLNVFHSDKFRVNFSNIPTVDDKIYLDMFDSFVKSITLPDYKFGVDRNVESIGYQIQSPIAHKINDNLPPLTVDFKLNENFYNYLKLWEWISNIKYGQNISTEHIKDYCCKSIIIDLLNNQKKKMAYLKYKNCFCTSLSRLSLTNGTSEEVIFTATFDHEIVTLEVEPLNNDI